MSVDTPSYRRATWEEYQALGEDARYEYIDGHIVVTPFPTPRHSFVISELQAALRATLPADYVSVSHSGWRVGRDEFGPDLMVVPRQALDAARFEGVPLLVVEVLSTDRARDTIVEVQKYARAGAPRYWLVDVRDRTLDALTLVDGLYEISVRLNEHQPEGDLDTGAGTAHVDVRTIFG